MGFMWSQYKKNTTACFHHAFLLEYEMSGKQFFGSILVTRHKHICLFLLWRAVDMPNIEGAWFLWSQVLGSNSVALRGDPYPFYFWPFENLIKVLGLLKEDVQKCTYAHVYLQFRRLRVWESSSGKVDGSLPGQPSLSPRLVHGLCRPRWQVPLSEVQWRPKGTPCWRLTCCLPMVSQVHLYTQCCIEFCIFRE